MQRGRRAFGSVPPEADKPAIGGQVLTTVPPAVMVLPL